MTLECLASLAALDYRNTQIIVVDNGSTDDSVAAIRERYPDVILIRNERNVGFAEGNNIAIRQALADGADLLMLLNNDAVVAPQTLTALVEAATRNPQIGIVAPVIYSYSEPEHVWCAGAAIDWRNGATVRLQDSVRRQPDGAAPQVVDFVSGCALCIKREVIEKIGLLDPRFFAYYEDTDWCVRAVKAGYLCAYVPSSCVWHRVSSTLTPASPQVTYYMTRNQLLFLSKHVRGLQRFVVLGRAIAAAARIIAVRSIRRNRADRDARVRALFDFLLGRYGPASF